MVETDRVYKYQNNKDLQLVNSQIFPSQDKINIFDSYDVLI